MAMTSDMLKQMMEPLFKACDKSGTGLNKEEALEMMTQMTKMQKGPDAVVDEARFEEGWNRMSTDGKL